MNPATRIFIPDGADWNTAISRVTHLGIGAHHDDLEFMAYHGILSCWRQPEKWFGGVTCTDGAGSARSGAYAHVTDEALREIRIREQETAATIGLFGAMVQLGLPSQVIKDPADGTLANDLYEILDAARPSVVYTHNPADKHDTHIAVLVSALTAMRALPTAHRPAVVHGCEVWRSLDWMLDSEKVAHNVSSHENLANALNGVFDSQISGGKRYDLAILGRRRANATFFDSHSTDDAQMLAFAMDLTPLVRDETQDILDYVLGFIHRFEDDVRSKLARQLRRT